MSRTINPKSAKLRKMEDFYLNFSENPSIVWFRGVLQSLDVELNPSLGLKISVGQFLEKFLFTQAEIIGRKRSEEAIRQLNTRLKKVEIDSKYISKHEEEYARLFLSFYGAVGSQSYERLRKAYVSQMVRFFDKKYSSFENKQFYQRLLFRLTIDHFALLTFSEKYLGNEKTRFENSKTLKDKIIKEFKSRKGLSETLVRGVIKDLDSMGLFNDWQSSAMGGDIHGLSLTDLARELLLQANGDLVR